MALQGWDKNYREQLKIQEQEIESLQQQLMISGGREPNEEDAPYRPAPIPNPGQPPWPGYPNPPRLAANNIVPTHGPLAPNDDDYGEGNVPGHPDWKLAGGPQLPNFKPMGRVIKGTREGVRTFDENKITQPLQIGPQAGATSRQIRDRLKGFTKGGSYDEQGGSLRGVPDALRIQLLRDAMAQAPANNIRQLGATGHQTVLDPITGQLKIIKTMGPQAAANNITRFRPHGWRTDYTGSFVLGDDGKLIPQMYLHKINS